MLIPLLVLASPDMAKSRHQPEPLAWEVPSRYPAPAIVRAYERLELSRVSCSPSRMSALNPKTHERRALTAEEKQHVRWAKGVQANYDRYKQRVKRERARDKASRIESAPS